MKRKKAMITVELVDESVMEANDKIARELFEWLRDDAFSMPWVRDVKVVIVEDK
jgi:hypothetical protein